MGYTTDFEGRFTLNRALDAETAVFLRKLNESRRMARKLGPEFGVEGEFYVDGGGDYGQAKEPSILNYNSPPRTQPSLWCQWRPTEDNLGIEWDGGEKFYKYVEWLNYIIANFIAPKGYVLNGDVKFQGEDSDDAGIIRCTNNVVQVIDRESAPSLLQQRDALAGVLRKIEQRAERWHVNGIEAGPKGRDADFAALLAEARAALALVDGKEGT